MSIDPFAAEVRKTQGQARLYARGACDTKGTAAAAFRALLNVHASPPKPSPAAQPAVLFTVDEEVAMAGVRHLTAHQLADLPGPIHSVIVGQPTNLQPLAAHAGLVRFTLTTPGTAAHSSVPSLGVNALSRLARLIVAFDAAYVPTVTAAHPLTGRAATAITTAHAGQSANVIPDHAAAQIDRRLAPGESASDAEHALRAVLDTTGDPYTLTADVTHPPFPDTHNAPLLDACADVLAAHDLPGTPIGAPFCTHASYWATLNVPVVVLGPGDPLQAHTHDESIAIADLDQGVAVYESLMRDRPG